MQGNVISFSLSTKKEVAVIIAKWLGEQTQTPPQPVR
jgi:hypothetical protein